jgi:hypothetical protein
MYINSCYYYERYSFYLEALYHTIGFLIAFCFYMNYENSTLVKTSVVVLVCKIVIILFCSSYWTSQLEYTRDIHDKMRLKNITKLKLNTKNCDISRTHSTWHFGYMSFCISQMDYEKNPVHFLFSNDTINRKSEAVIKTEFEHIENIHLKNKTFKEIKGSYINLDQI